MGLFVTMGKRDHRVVALVFAHELAVLLVGKPHQALNRHAVIDGDGERLALPELRQRLECHDDRLGVEKIACIDLHGSSISGLDVAVPLL